MKLSPPTVNWSLGRGLATSLARSSKVAVSAWMMRAFAEPDDRVRAAYGTGSAPASV
jgi:hypothetical protein